MNFKTTYLLFGALAVMLGALAVVMIFHSGGGDGGGESGRLFPSVGSQDKNRKVAADDITKVVIQRKTPAGADIVFERDGGKNWKLTAPRALRADGGQVSNLVDAILNARTDKDGAPRSLKEGGLDAPSRVILLTGKDRTLELKIGHVDPGESGFAAVTSSDQRGKPLAVRKRSIESALEDVNYFRGRDLLGDNTSDITSIKISQGKKGTVELAKDKDRWRFVQPGYGEANVDNAFLTQLGDLRVEYRNEKDNDFVQDGVADLAKVDPELPKSEELRIEVGRGEEKKQTKTSVVVLTGKKVGEKYYAFVDDGGKEKDVVKINAKAVESLVKILDDPSSLRSKNLLALEPFKTPDAIDVQNSYGLLEFRKPEGAKGWELFRDGKGNPTDESEVRLLLDALNRPNQVVSFPDPKRRKELGLEKPDLTVKVWSDSLDKPDAKKPGKPPFKKDAKVVTELRFGNREGENVAVERVWGSDSTIVLVPAVSLEQLRKRPLAYFDKSVPGFATGPGFDQDVTKVEVRRAAGDSYELTREKPGAPWKFTKPESWKGRPASEQVVREILMDMNRLPVREVSAEKADAGELAKVFELEKPANKVVITSTSKDKKDTTFVVDVGKEVSGKGYYAKVSGKDTIYLVEGKVLDGLKKDPRDTTVFNFDPDKVVSVKLTGWHKLLGGAETRTLEKKDGKWAIKEKPDFVIDPDKVRQTLDGLSRLNAERFVKAGKGLTLKENALQIEVTLEDKKTLSLTIGELEGPNEFFATSDQLKGEVFTVRKDLFEAAKNSPASFGK